MLISLCKQTVKMAPGRDDLPKRIAAPGCRLPAKLPADEILTDVTQNKWRLGTSIGYGGFGDIYLASKDITSPVGDDAQYVIKIEPHNNGPLFVEMNFYIRASRKHMIESWCKTQRKRRIGVPTYEGSGSHIYNGQRYRFLVIPRYGIDIGKLFISNNRKLPNKLVNNLAVQMLDALEYIHSHGYAHADIKGPNILLAPYDDSVVREKSQAYLVDYGLAYRFRTTAGIHKPFVHDERRAHEGTLEFTSRDAHHGTHSRRGDLETLGYNLIQWTCGKLPWEKDNNDLSVTINPEEVHAEKEALLSNLPLFMEKCFANRKNYPPALMEYMKYITELSFESKPNYSYLRSLFQFGTNQERCVPTCLFNNIQESNENTCATSIKRPYLRERKPCRPVNGEIRITRNTQSKSQPKKFCWEEVLAFHPDRLAKINIQTPPTTLTPPPSPPPSPISSPIPSLPTYAMLDVIRKMKEKQSGSFKHKPRSIDSDIRTKWMTPAMEEVVVRLKKRSAVSLGVSIEDSLRSNISGDTPRVTRSRVAKLKRLGTNDKFDQPKERKKRSKSKNIDDTK
ncbi:PREDICTED: serine/threonine-protein kinase VRK1-like isoform X2 [Polistes dominula]|uniref:non-specific serine/threonine protein kinase n=1 Tax=Polistes dominula TaxID=743375 RepID=A0ABM1J954_POLDO|nr:PREDICTED: serine/threonine-protein kinase VRK1-like isoform X2 [Polistes dominula]